MIDNKIIVVGSEHHNTLGVLRSFGEIGIRPDLIITKEPKPFVIHCRYINTVYRISCETEIVEILLTHFGGETLPPIVVCCNDKSSAIIDENYDKLSDLFILPNARGLQGEIKRLMSKTVQYQLAKQVGIIAPKTWTIKGNQPIPQDIVYPCIVKTDASVDGSKSDIKVCHTFEELRDNTSREVEYLVQEYIDKDYELNVVACSCHKGQDVVVPGVIHKIREYPIRKGSSSFSVLEPCSSYPNLPVDKIKQILALIEYDGLFSIEFVCKGDKCYFLEINLRNDGNGYVPTSAGVNLPYIWSYSRVYSKIPTYKSQTPHYFMADMRDIFHVIKNRTLTFREWYKDLKRTNCFLLYNRRDKKPFYVFLWYWCVDVLRLLPRKICKMIGFCK